MTSPILQTNDLIEDFHDIGSNNRNPTELLYEAANIIMFVYIVATSYCCVDDFKSEDIFFPPRLTFSWLPSSIDKPECDDDQERFVDLWVVAQTFHLEREHVMKMYWPLFR